MHNSRPRSKNQKSFDADKGSVHRQAVSSCKKTVERAIHDQRSKPASTTLGKYAGILDTRDKTTWHRRGAGMQDGLPVRT